MSEHATVQFRHSLERKIVDVWGEFAPVATNVACTLTAAKNKGIKSVTRTGTGAYSILANDKTYNRLVEAEFRPIVATGNPAAPLWRIVSRGVDATTGFYKVAVLFTAADGTTATDPATTETMLVHLAFADSAI